MGQGMKTAVEYQDAPSSTAMDGGLESDTNKTADDRTAPTTKGQGAKTTPRRAASKAKRPPIPPTRENVRAALTYLSADIDGDDWHRILRAVADGLGQDGRDLADEWSQTAPHRYSAAIFRDSWKSACKPGKTTIATLWKMALNAGWKPDGTAHQETEAERQARERQRDERNRKAEQEAKLKRTEAAKKAGAIWQAATELRADHPYMARKGIKPVSALREIPVEQAAGILGYRPKSDGEPLAGRLIVAPVKVAGELSTLEFIDEQGRKSAIAGGAKAGGFWAAKALPEGDGAGLVLVIGEGVATVLSIHQATDYPAIAALSAGNIPQVAKIMCDRYPKARVLILADLGNGQAKAEEAATATGAKLAVPIFTPAHVQAHQEQHGKPPTDFNDLAQLAGLDEVRRQIEQALQGEAPPAKGTIPANFKLDKRGLWFEESTGGEDKEEARETSKIFICSPLRVTAETRTRDQDGWGRLLEWEDRDGHPHKVALPMSKLEGEPGGVCAELADRGLDIGVGSKVRNLLVRYIKQCRPTIKARCVNRIGWHEGAYVLPTLTLGERNGERVIFQAGTSSPGDFRQKGTVEEWRATVAALCAGNSRPMTAIGFAFTAPLLQFEAAGESGGAHFRGDSSSGKSTVLWAAASVYGPPTGDNSFRKEWRATSNGMEGMATSRNDSLLILDEMGQVDGREAGNIAYMLANGQPKARMFETTALRKAPSWRLLFLSTGEISLADHMAAAGTKIKAGQENRIADIPAEPFRGFGVFDQLNGYPDGASLSIAIRDAANSYHGAVGLAFIEHVIRVQDSLRQRIRAFTAQFVADVVPKGANGQVVRVGQRFGLVAAALELAGEFGLTGWEPEQGTWAVKTCFNDWLHQRGGAGNLEDMKILAQVRAFFESHGESRFSDWDSAERTVSGVEAERRAVVNRVGFRRKSQAEGYTYYVFSEAFKTEICAGLDPNKAAQVLKERGWIAPDKEGKTTQGIKLPGFGKTTRCYLFTPQIWE